VAGDRVLSVPVRPAGAALVVAVDQAQVIDDPGHRGEVVGDPGTTVHHDHGKPPGGYRASGPGAQPRPVIHLHHRLGHESEANASGRGRLFISVVELKGARSQGDLSLSCPGAVELGVLLPHLAGVIVEGVAGAAGVLIVTGRARAVTALSGRVAA
jgi:hypothetical protein